MRWRALLGLSLVVLTGFTGCLDESFAPSEPGSEPRSPPGASHASPSLEGAPTPFQSPDPGRGKTQAFAQPVEDGSRIAVRWEVTRASAALFHAAGGSGELAGWSISLWTPEGEEVAIVDELADGRSGKELEGGFAYEATIGDGFLDRVLVGVEEPDDGIWTLVLEGPAPDAGNASVLAELHLDSPLRLEQLWEGGAVEGEPFVFEVAVKDGNETVPDASVYGRIYDHGVGQRVNLTFRDDGVAPDEEAGDGIYTTERTFSSGGQPVFWIEARKDGWVRSLEPGFYITGPEWADRHG